MQLNYMKYFLLFILSISLIACKSKQSVFIGEWQVVDNVEPINITLDKVDLSVVGSVHITAVNKYLLFYTFLLNSTQIAVYDIDDFHHLGSFIHKGRGHNERMNVNPAINNSIERDDQFWFITYDDKEVIGLNIRESLERNKTILSEPICLKDADIKGLYSSYVMNDSTIIIKTSNESPIDDQLLVYNYMSNHIISSVPLYNSNIKDRRSTFSIPVVKPDGSKYAETMILLDQLNICNIDGSDALSVSLSPKPTYLSLPDRQIHPSEMTCYYRNAIATDEYIICIYNIQSESSEIHYYDWDGKLIHRLQTSVPISSIALNNSNNNLICFVDESNIYTLPYNRITSTLD